MTVVPRRAVWEFAVALETRLAANDHKSRWEDLSVQECLEREAIEADELHQELRQDAPSLKAVRRELLDRANYLLFAWHNAANEYQEAQHGG